MEGYGLTESTAAATLCKFPDTSSGNVGGPARGLDIKLIDVPEMNYFTNNVKNGISFPEGEICMRGPIIFKGYYK